MKSKTLWLLLLILIIASFLRLYHITTVPPGLYPDEAMNGNNALQAINTGDYKVFYPENNGREGLFMNIQALFLKFFGANEPWVLRLPSNIFGILTVLGIYFLAKELFAEKSANSESNTNTRIYGEQSRTIRKFETNSLFADGNAIALLSAFFLAASFWHILFSRIGFRAIMAPAFLIWAVYLLLKTLNKTKNEYQINNRFKNFILPVLAGAMYGLGFYSYIAYRITPILILFILLYYWLTNKDSFLRKKILRSTFYFLLFTFIVALPLGIYFLQHPADFMGRTTQVSVFSSASPLGDLLTNTVKTLGMFNFSGDWNWRHNYAGSPELFWPVGILFILGVFIGIKSIVKSFPPKADPPRAEKLKVESNFGYWILFLWFFLAMLPVVISNEGIPHALRSILMIPPVFIFAGIGGVAAYDWLKKYLSEYWLRAIVAFAAAFIVSSTYYTYFISWAQNPNVQGAFAANYVEIGREINNFPASVPKYVVVEAGGVPVNGIPMPAQTVMFITDTFSLEGQKTKNIRYVLPDQEKNIPTGVDSTLQGTSGQASSPRAEIFYIR